MAGREPSRGAAPEVAEREPARSGDPVRDLMARHRVLCEQAVDALEIAAGLEEAGFGPGSAARYRHADVFALAEELFARVPRRPPAAGAGMPGESWRRRSAAALWTALPVALPCAVPVAVRATSPGPVGAVDLAAAVLAAVLVGSRLAVGAARTLPPGPGRPGAGRSAGRWPTARRAAACGYGLGAAAVLLLPSSAGAPGRVQGAMVLAAALATGSAEWSARWYRQVGRLHLRTAGTITDFRARMRPVLPVAVGLHLVVLAVLTFAALAVLTAVAPRPGPHAGGLLHQAAHRADGRQWAAQAALGLLLVLAALLLHCGRARAAGAGTVAAGAVTALLLLRRAAWPGVAWAPPAGYGAAGAQLVGCGVVCAILLPYAWAVLGRPGSHR